MIEVDKGGGSAGRVEKGGGVALFRNDNLDSIEEIEEGEVQLA